MLNDISNFSNFRSFEKPKASLFWIMCGDVTLSMDVSFHEETHLKILSCLLKQKINENNSVCFGVDEINYTEFCSDKWKLPPRLPHSRACSYLWFSAGNLIVPFRRKNLSTNQILLIFDFIRKSAMTGEIIHLGVDKVEFPLPSKFKNSSLKLKESERVPQNNEFISTKNRKESTFWISCGDVTISIEVSYHSKYHLQRLRHLLKQKINENHVVSFGIDEIQYTEIMDNEWKLPQRLPHPRACSYLWFSAGGLIIPFNAKNLSAYRILLIFDFIRKSALSGESIRFGVDYVQFPTQISSQNKRKCAPENNESVTNTCNLSSLTPSTSKRRKESTFWISCGNITISIDISYHTSERLRHMRGILKQKIKKDHLVSFGIDEIRFTENINVRWKLPERLPHARACSYLWFSAGGLVIPFVGKNLSVNRILLIFDFIRNSGMSGELIYFGVDNFTLLKPREFDCFN